MKLTSSQNAVYEKFGNFLIDSNQVMILRGYAGTGKTTLLKELISLSGKEGREFSLLAPTGRAVKVLEEVNDSEASTIHRTIYGLSHISGDIESGRYKHIFALKNNSTDSDDHIYFIDESSMISDLYSNSETISFGSGNLLFDLLAYTAIHDKNTARKIVFIGDTFQLPPIKSLLSPALDANYLRSKYHLNVLDCSLNEVVRQNNNSTILENANLLRDENNQDYFRDINFEIKEDVRLCEAADMTDRYIDSISRYKSNIIIAQTNNSVHNYNYMVRHKIYQDAIDSLMENEKLLVTENNYNHSVHIMNGDFLQIKEVYQRESRDINLNGGPNVRLNFRDVLVSIEGVDKLFTFKCKVLENLLQSKSTMLSREERRALLVDLIMRNKDISPKSAEFLELMRTDKYFNSIKVKYGYAITCHKAQGGEWDNVFVDLQSTKQYITEDYRRWAYTAITRSKKNLFLMNNDMLSSSKNILNHLRMAV